jgi:hypothetical protein
MKKLFVIALILCLLIPSVQAEMEDIDYFTFEYNINTVLTGAEKLKEGAYSFDGKYYEFISGDGEITGFILDESGKINQGFCICNSEENIGDFFARCATLAFTLDCIEDISNIYTILLDQYFTIRIGQENEADIVNIGVVMEMTRVNNGKYLFQFVNTNLK